MNKKLLILSTASIVLTATVIGVGFKAGGLSFLTNASLAPSECLHEHVEHYDAIESTTEFGHLEYWCCCDCHASFNHEPTPNDVDVIPSTAGNPTDYNDGRSIYPLINEFSLAASHTLIDDKSEVDTYRGFLRAYSLTGNNNTYSTGMSLSGVNLLKYDLIAFSLKVTNGKWVEPFKADEYGTTTYSGATNSSTYKLFMVQRKDSLSLTYDWLVDGVRKQTFTVSQNKPFLSDYVTFRVAKGAEVVVSELRGIPNEVFEDTVISNTFISGATYDSTNLESSINTTYHSGKVFNDIDISNYKKVYFNLNVESTNYIDIYQETADDFGCVRGDNLVILDKNSDDTWNVRLNSSLKSPIHSNLELNGSTLGLKLTANETTKLTMSRLFGILDNSYEVITEPQYKKVADYLIDADDSWSYSTADYTSEYTYDYRYAIKKQHKANETYNGYDADITGIDHMIMYLSESVGTSPYIYFSTTTTANFEYSGPAKTWLPIEFTRGEDPTVWTITMNGKTHDFVTETGNNLNEFKVKLLNHRTYLLSPLYILGEKTTSLGGSPITGASSTSIYVPETITTDGIYTVTSNAYNKVYNVNTIVNPYQYSRISFYIMGGLNNNTDAFVQPSTGGSSNNHGIWNLFELRNNGNGFDAYYGGKKRNAISDLSKLSFKLNPGTYYFTSYCCE